MLRVGIGALDGTIAARAIRDALPKRANRRTHFDRTAANCPNELASSSARCVGSPQRYRGKRTNVSEANQTAMTVRCVSGIVKSIVIEFISHAR